MEKDFYEEVRFQNYNENDPIIISVAMIAYNVEKFISEAIESVLIQRTKFRVQLVIGEDCSLDSTRKIILDYQKKYPNIIKVLLPKKNQGLTPNCIATINACDGKYVALLDSDDYWTNVNKLQMQITFLEKNELYSGASHQSLKIYDDNSSESILFGSQIDEIYELKDTISHRKFHTSSLIFRNSIWKQVGGIPSNISSNERAIYPLIGCFGKIMYFKESMCVYRFSGYGLSSRIDFQELETDLAMLPWLKKINNDFPIFQFKSFLHLCIYSYGKPNKPIFPLIKHYFLFSIFSFAIFPNNLGNLKQGTIEFWNQLNRKK